MTQPHDPTPGVDIGTFHVPGVGEVSLWDFAGQAEYAVTHSMFMDAENTVFIVLYNIMDDSEEQERQVTDFSFTFNIISMFHFLLLLYGHILAQQIIFKRQC